MTRIIAGAARGRRLRVPAGKGTRPTSDRAREGLFSSLQSLTPVVGCRFLDLYAGSGALGLEALSRGAAHVTLVEQDERALAALRANAALVGGPGAVEVVALSVPRFLAGAPVPYDVVVLDPPYDLDVRPVLDLVVAWVAEDGTVAVERRSRDAPLAWPAGLAPVRSRRYGEAALWYGSRS